MEYEKKQKIKLIIFIIFIYAFCAFLCSLGVIHYFDDYGKADAIRKAVKVQAEWYAIIPNMNERGISTTYDLGYIYVDDNGVIYKEQCAFHLSSYEEAKSYMGKKVEIYIDGKGHSIPVDEAKDFNQNFAWITMGIAIGIAVGFTAGLIIWGVIKHRRKKQESIEDASIDTVKIDF